MCGGARAGGGCVELPEWNCHDYMYSDPAWILQSAEDQQRFLLCLASLASQVVAAAFGLRVRV